MAFRVKQTAEVDHDLDVILEWLMAQQAGETGLRWFRGLKDTQLVSHRGRHPFGVSLFNGAALALYGERGQVACHSFMTPECTVIPYMSSAHWIAPFPSSRG
jgi:hypothetical protein